MTILARGWFFLSFYMSQVKELLVVGGGSAGWIAASYLNAALNYAHALNRVNITLVESPDTPRISVGEATVPAIAHVLSVIGIDELEFMKQTDATFKQSIKYVNWLYGRGEIYHHPFSRYRPGPIDRSASDWIATDRSIPFTDTVSAQPLICEMGLAPKMLGPWDFGAKLTYAFHMNAQKFADYLRDIAIGRGVRHIYGHVTGVKRAANGYIENVRLKDQSKLSADLFIDCTGFSAQLIGKTLSADWEDFSQYLLCDKALVKHIPYKSYFPSMVRPYTTASALKNGWIWDIPMRSARSIGYVYSSAFCSREQAEQEILAYEGPHANACNSKSISFRSGRRRNHWVGNCVAIGLSSGFVEPLESTGLYLADLAAVMLAEHFPYNTSAIDGMAFRFNRIMNNRYFEILDFINMHYCLTRRTDTDFWREVQKPEHITERLKAKLAFWQEKLPSAADFEDQFFPNQSSTTGIGSGGERAFVDTGGLWNHESYEAILYGMDFRGPEFESKLGSKRPRTKLPEFMLARLRGAKQKLPPHHIWLHQKLSMPQYEMHAPPPGWV